MVTVDELRALDRPQRAAFVAALLGWALDAFDYFLLTFILKAIAADFRAQVSDVSIALTLTLAARPVGAFVFGRLADRFGRRPILMIDVALYSALAVASAFAPNLITLLVLRTLFGFAMGGEWGIGSSLALETVPAKSRGVISGILQEGYPMGFFLAAIANLFVPTIGWRGLLALGAVPALLILYIRRNVPESPAWEAGRAAGHPRLGFLAAVKGHWGLLIYAVVLMTCFNFFSHGTQDLYPTFLQVQHGFAPAMVTTLTIVLNVGAIVGGFVFGPLSEKIGRRRAIAIAALLALPIIPLWAFTASPLLLGCGVFLIQVAVQGAWAVVPAHLNELSPAAARGTFPGFAYQLGNLFAASNAFFQARLAEARHNDYGLALALVCGVVALVLTVVAWLGPERKGVAFGQEAPRPVPGPGTPAAMVAARLSGGLTPTSTAGPESAALRSLKASAAAPGLTPSHDVFISYSSKDKSTADAVCAIMEREGVRCWITPRDVRPGQEWAEEILHAIAGAKVVVLIFSASSNTSPQVRREIERAVHNEVAIIPVRIEDATPSASLEYFISTPHWLDAITPPLEAHVVRLAQTVKAMLAERRD